MRRSGDRKQTISYGCPKTNISFVLKYFCENLLHQVKFYLFSPNDWTCACSLECKLTQSRNRFKMINFRRVQSSTTNLAENIYMLMCNSIKFRNSFQAEQIATTTIDHMGHDGQYLPLGSLTK